MATTRCGSIASSDERLRHTSKFARARWSSRRGERGRYRRVARSIPARAEDTVGVAEYGGSFAAAAASDGMFAVQFHPEKSQLAGKRVLDAFASWVASS